MDSEAAAAVAEAATHQRRAPEAQNVLIIKIQNGGREGEEEVEGEGKVKLQRTLNLVGSQFVPLSPSLSSLSSMVPLFSGAYV